MIENRTATTTRATRTRPAALPATQRALAPDLARGAMLLLICLANATVYLVGPPGFRGFPAPASMTGLDRVLTVVQLALVDGRAFPLFGLLVGYGAWQLASRRLAAGTSPRDVRHLLRRRGLALAAVGVLHGVLLFAGDIAAAYGLLLVCLAGAVVAGRRRLVAGAVVGSVLVTLVGSVMALQPPVEASVATGGGSFTSIASASVLTAGLWRVPEFVVVGVVANTLMVAGAVCLGVLAARRRLLDDPARHLRLLRVVAIVGLSAAALGGLPIGLVAAGYVEVDTGVVLAAGALHAVTGYLGGAGYAAVAGLVAARLLAARPLGTPATAPPPRPVGALTALGRRSLTGYLLHSVVLVTVMPLWSLGLGDDVGVGGAALVGLGTWLLLVLAAVAMERAGRRGPAEVLLRRLTYGARRAPRPAGATP